MNFPEFTVSEFSRSIKRVVEDAFGFVRIKGEVSGFKRAASGHLYFSLKDEEALLNAVCFKNEAEALQMEVADGLQIVAMGRITTFGGRSNYQIIVEKIEISGIGAILEMIEKRRAKLAAEGLFDASHKKPLPFFPRKIGVITSEIGAVIQDIRTRVAARSPTHLLLYAVLVQGKDAPAQIIRGIKFFNKMPKEERPEILIIARGGGSFEDLLPFNDEELVRAVFASEIPVISAIGHETDITLIDFVADVRAPTPTAAAELATPVLSELKNRIKYCEAKLAVLSENFLRDKKNHLENLQKYLIDPKKYLANMAEKISVLEKNMSIIVDKIFSQNQQKLVKILFSKQPIFHKINLAEEKTKHLVNKLKSRVGEVIKNHETTLKNFEKLLVSNHYREILKRGFALVKNGKNEAVFSINNVHAKEEIIVEMSDGKFRSYVVECIKNDKQEIAAKPEKLKQNDQMQLKLC